jgi:hypothetical protein
MVLQIAIFQDSLKGCSLLLEFAGWNSESANFILTDPVLSALLSKRG